MILFYLFTYLIVGLGMGQLNRRQLAVLVLGDFAVAIRTVA